MQVLIVEQNRALATVWARHLERLGLSVTLADDQDSAIAALQQSEYATIVLNLVLEDGSSFAVADFASYRWPDTRVVFVTDSSFFSDGSIFNHFANAAAFVGREGAPEDLAALVEHHAVASASRA